jgi:hypothetical protein
MKEAVGWRTHSIGGADEQRLPSAQALTGSLSILFVYCPFQLGNKVTDVAKLNKWVWQKHRTTSERPHVTSEQDPEEK